MSARRGSKKSRPPKRARGGTKRPRRPKPALISLVDMISRVDPHHVLNGKPDKLTIPDRQRIAELLRRIAADEDVSVEYFAPVANRPRSDAAVKSAAAFVYFAQLKLGERNKGTALIAEIAKDSGLTRDQVEHAIRDHKSNSLAWIASTGAV